MGELIRREAAATPLDFSGERLTAAISGQVEIEHYHRYFLAREFCRGKDVLDVAAGEGYGTALLAQVARSAVGVEIDAAAVDAARAEFSRPNLRFEQGDARSLPLSDASIDVAVSFETLEHLAEQDVFLSELHRVLRPEGLLIISTPDRDAYSPLGMPPNPFHVLELTTAEFDALLRRHFRHTALASQRAIIGSVILGQGPDRPVRTYERRSEDVIEGSDQFSRAPYTIALASDAPLPPLPNSVYVYRHDVDTDPQVRREAELGRIAAEQSLATAEDRIAASAANITALEQQIKDQQRAAEASSERIATLQKLSGSAIEEAEALRVRAETLEQDLADSKASAERVARQAAESDARLRAIETSSIWRVTRPLRNIGHRFPFFARNLRRAVQLVWWTATLQLPNRYRMWRAHRRSRLQVPEPETDGGQPQFTDVDIDAPATTSLDVRVPCSDNPTVSIIIPTYGQVDTTLACLQSIAQHAPRCRIEVIVVDDAYVGDEDPSVLRDVAGIHLIRNDTNLGFLRSCNQAARVAKGRYLHLLNNDTELRADSIDALADLLDTRPNVGLVGSKLLFSDGRLQEAGGIIWNDGSGWNYGRGDDPSRSDYNYIREVDYCSAASIMIRAELFHELGGFDEAFAPAYYEDTDLAFRVRAHGMQVMYEPRSVVIHHEGVSHGTDLTSGVKAHQVINQRLMIDRWGSTFNKEHYPNGQHVLRARDRARTCKVILIIDHYVPEPDRDAGSRSTMGLLDSLVDLGWVVKFFPHNRAYSPVYTVALERRGIEVIDHRWPGGLRDWLRQNGDDLDHLMVMRPHIAAEVLSDIMGTTGAALCYYGHDLHFVRMRHQADVEENPGALHDAIAMERLERQIWRNFDVVIYLSEYEAATVREISPGTLARSIVGFCFDTYSVRTHPPEERNILFVAGFAHPPNVDAAVFLINTVLPLLEREVGPVKVMLAGSNPTETVRALGGPNVEVTGYVSDDQLNALYDKFRVAVVPLRFGAGVKGKVVEALSHGVPLVTTSVGAQGIPGLASVVPVHDDAGDIAAALKVLLIDDETWIAQSTAQIEFAQRNFSRSAMQRSVVTALEAGEEAAAKRRPLAPEAGGPSQTPLTGAGRSGSLQVALK